MGLPTRLAGNVAIHDKWNVTSHQPAQRQICLTFSKSALFNARLIPTSPDPIPDSSPFPSNQIIIKQARPPESLSGGPDFPAVPAST